MNVDADVSIVENVPYDLTHRSWIRDLNNFPRGISSKINLIP